MRKAQLAITLYNHWRAAESKEWEEKAPENKLPFVHLEAKSSDDLQNLATFKIEECYALSGQLASLTIRSKAEGFGAHDLQAVVFGKSVNPPEGLGFLCKNGPGIA